MGNGGFVIDGEHESDRAGESVSGAGDVDGDGLADLIIGAPYSSADAFVAGRAYVVFGKADADLADVIVGAPGVGFYDGRTYVVYGKSDTDAMELADVELGHGGFALTAENEEDGAGGEVSGAGDVDGDGFADLLVAASHADPNGASSGRTYVVFGVPTGPG